MRATDASATLSYGEAGAVHAYSGEWGNIILTLHHALALSPALQNAIAKLPAGAVVKEFKQNPPARGCP